ncbi:MAG: alpha/beta hydrolase [bacterium]|nr:alpha/beta hydrolase [bacterium]
MTTLVFVHGFIGGSAQWSSQREFFNDRYNVVTIDLPGFGENSNMTAPDRIRDYANFVHDKLTAKGIDEFDLVGHSMGGMIVQEMVATAPARIKKLVLYGTGAVGILPGRFETIEESKHRALIDGPKATTRRISATWFLHRSAAVAYEHCATIAEHASIQAICAGLDAMQSWSAVERLPNIESPTLVLWGDNDRTYSWPQIEQLWRTIPNAALAVVPDCAHAVHFEKPTIFNALLDDFLK